MKAHDGMYIGGEWRPARGRDTITVVNPADERVVGHVPAGGAGDVDDAVRAARAALPGWAPGGPRTAGPAPGTATGRTTMLRSRPRPWAHPDAGTRPTSPRP